MGLKSEIDSPSPEKVESEMCKRLQASQIARSRAMSGSTNASEGRRQGSHQAPGKDGFGQYVLFRFPAKCQRIMVSLLQADQGSGFEKK